MVNADHVGHEAYQPQSQVWQEVVDTFGEQVLKPTGEIDRERLGAIVFDDLEARAKLNSMMHPRMGRMMQERLDKLRRQGVEVMVLEAALLLEAGWDSLVDEVWVTSSPPEQVVERIRQRNHLSEKEARSRISSQMHSEERASYAQVLVDNSGSLDELREQVETLWNTRVEGKVQ